MIVRRLLNYLSFALTTWALFLALDGCWGGMLAMFFAGPSGLLALTVIAMLIVSPPVAMKGRMLEAELAFGFSIAVMLVAASEIHFTPCHVC